MNVSTKSLREDATFPTRLPSWITVAQHDDAGLSAGAALAVLDMRLNGPQGHLPAALLRDRLALQASLACLKLEGRRDTEAEVRDAICLSRADDGLGPAGEMFARWRGLSRVDLSSPKWAEALGRSIPASVLEGLSPEQGASPAARAAQVLAQVLREFPRQEAAALMLADVAIARALGWGIPVPLLAAHMPSRTVRAITGGEDRVLEAVQTALVAASDAVLRQAADLTRRAERLRLVAPKLRAKASGPAVALFLSHDAVSPSGMLSPIVAGSAAKMTDRAARRLCDRLVELGVARELTGRASFRLYGV